MIIKNKTLSLVIFTTNKIQNLFLLEDAYTIMSVKSKIIMLCKNICKKYKAIKPLNATINLYALK